MSPSQERPMTACRQCGTCCRKGGPALRQDDIELVRQGHIRHYQLLVVRQGELGYNPATGKVEPVPVELLKIRGQDTSWTCLFLDNATLTCTIYAHRPATCRILECWAPAPLLATIYQDTLQRRDLLNPDDPIHALLDRHDRESPAAQWGVLLIQATAGNIAAADLGRLSALVRADLAIRAEAARLYGISMELEFFLFGRPLFTQLAGTHIVCIEENGEINLRQG